MGKKVAFPKHQTVEWWIQELSQLKNQKAVLKLSTGPTNPKLCALSFYEGDKPSEAWVDVGTPDCED